MSEYRRARKRPGERGLPKVHYEVVIERIDDPAWSRPFQAKYPGTDWTVKTAEERRELRRRYQFRYCYLIRLSPLEKLIQ